MTANCIQTNTHTKRVWTWISSVEKFLLTKDFFYIISEYNCRGYLRKSIDELKSVFNLIKQSEVNKIQLNISIACLLKIFSRSMLLMLTPLLQFLLYTVGENLEYMFDCCFNVRCDLLARSSIVRKVRFREILAVYIIAMIHRARKQVAKE